MSGLSDTNLVFDNIDVDLVIKVLNNTLFGPFFLFFVPLFYMFQGTPVTHPIVIASGGYFSVISLFWLTRWCSRLYRNQGSLLVGPPPLDWGEQIVVITGGASGIGELLANTLAVRNVTVVVLDVSPIITENYNITYYKCDVSKWEEVEAVAKQIKEELGEPTILINNAGVVQGKLLLDLTEKDVNQTFGTNTLAHFWTLKAFLPGMIEQKSGHIVTISSVMGMTGTAQMTDYCASKAALIVLNQALRYELDHRYNCPQIRTTLVVPGHIQTRMFKTVDLPMSLFRRFFIPSLQPITVVKKIIAALDETHSQTIYLPFYANFAPYVNLLPSFARDVVQWVTNADYAMKTFVKISGRRMSEGEVPAFVSRDKKD